jgi:hypothetical protein
MNTQTTIDHGKIMQAAKALKANPPKAADIVKDPKAFLAAQGINIGSDIEAGIRLRLLLSAMTCRSRQPSI